MTKITIGATILIAAVLGISNSAGEISDENVIKDIFQPISPSFNEFAHLTGCVLNSVKREIRALQQSSQKVVSQTKRMMETTRRKDLRSFLPQATDQLKFDLDAWLEDWNNVISVTKIDIKNRQELAQQNLRKNKNNRSSNEQNKSDASLLDFFENIVDIFASIPKQVICNIFGCNKPGRNNKKEKTESANGSDNKP